MKSLAVLSFNHLSRAVRHAWHIVREVLRGYLMGQPPNEERPRKSCC